MASLPIDDRILRTLTMSKNEGTSENLKAENNKWIFDRRSSRLDLLLILFVAGVGAWNWSE